MSLVPTWHARTPRPHRTVAALGLSAVAAATSVLALMVPAAGAAPAPVTLSVVPGTANAAAASASSTGAKSTVRFPRLSTTGVPRGWSPERTTRRTVRITEPGAVVRDLRVVGADIEVAAPDVTLRRVEVVGGSINNFAGPTCQRGMRVVSSTVRRGEAPTSGDWPAIGTGGYVARNVLIDGMPEGFRVGGKAQCGGVRIVASVARVVSPDRCGEWHGDAVQGYDGGRLTLRRSVLALVERRDCGGTAPFFYPRDQGNTSVDIDGLAVSGGGFAFRLGTPGSVRNLHVVRPGWGYGPIDVNCPAVSGWEASISRLDGQGQPVSLRRQRCVTSGGF